MIQDCRLVLLPGLGADARLFGPQRRAFPHLIVPPWISPKKNESLPSYAARMAETVEKPSDVPLVLGGVSFGGMVAYEMARHLQPAAVVQIASCRTRRGLRRWYRAVVPLMPLVPLQTWSVAKWLAPPVVTVLGRFGARDRTLAVAMFQEMDSAFMHWALSAILRWEPKTLEGVPLRQIHGRRDLLLPARCVEADLDIPSGGHMINITHADDVNAFIAAAMERVRAR